jgi:hypothetical protein
LRQLRDVSGRVSRVCHLHLGGGGRCLIPGPC